MCQNQVKLFFFFFFSSRRRHTRCREVSWARRCVQETDQRRVHGISEEVIFIPRHASKAEKERLRKKNEIIAKNMQKAMRRKRPTYKKKVKKDSTDSYSDFVKEVEDYIKKIEKEPQKLETLTNIISVSYTHLRAHETSLHLVCRLLLEKKKKKNNLT
eukprot:TRINITY_DN18557_c0_g1_i2.p2 TRINITY_DN18557_c0_g1~~TRINITY_DN18557_c0_g1_i2.p2  ORF type:complete len:158 (+),score=71.83 TRINITY_DN18557_c0_g1_i2:100-573(+)